MVFLFAACAAPEPELEARRKEIKEQIRALVGDLGDAGRYDCCIETACSLCATRSGGCRCGEGLRDGEPVCEECALMWHQGRGAEPVDPSRVRSFLEAAKEETARAQGKDICGQPLARP